MMVELIAVQRPDHAQIVRARCEIGKQSENDMPDAPYWRNGRWLAQTFAVGLMNAKRRPLCIDSGKGSPSSFADRASDRTGPVDSGRLP